MRASPPHLHSLSCSALLEHLRGEHVQAIHVVGPEDHENGVTVLRGHASQFDRLPPDQLNAVGLSLIAQHGFKADR
jgi:hypothetical protein